MSSIDKHEIVNAELADGKIILHSKCPKYTLFH